MPKMKTHKGAAKRFKVTATGKVLRRRAGHGHLLSGKSPRARRRLRKYHKVHVGQAWRAKELMQA